MAPQAHLQKAVVQGLAHPTHRPAAPTDSLQQLLELNQIKGVGLAEDQRQLVVGGGTQAGLLSVLLEQRRLWNLQRGGRCDHSRANPFSCSSANWA